MTPGRTGEGEAGPARFLVYGLIENTGTDHTIKFLGEVNCAADEDTIEHAVDGLLAGDWGRYEAALVFRASTYWQVDEPSRRGAKLGYWTDANNPRRMRVRL